MRRVTEKAVGWRSLKMNHMRMVLGEKDSIPIKSTMLAATYQVRPPTPYHSFEQPVQYVHLSLSNPVVYQRHNREYMLSFFSQ